MDTATDTNSPTPATAPADTGVSLTAQAVTSIKKLLAENEMVGFGLRFGIQGGGCSGYMYQLEFEEAPASDDEVYDFDGVRVFLSPEHKEKLSGTVIDWEDSLMGSGFKIENPHAKRPCGCGESVDF